MAAATAVAQGVSRPHLIPALFADTCVSELVLDLERFNHGLRQRGREAPKCDLVPPGGRIEYLT